MANGFGHSPEARRWALGAAALTTLLAVHRRRVPGRRPDRASSSSARCWRRPRSGPARDRCAGRLRRSRSASSAGVWNDILPRGASTSPACSPLAIGASRVDLDRRPARAAASARTTSCSRRTRSRSRWSSRGRSRTRLRRRSRRSGARSTGSSACSGGSTRPSRSCASPACWQEPGMQAAGFVGLSRRTTFAPRRGAARARRGSATSPPGSRTSRSDEGYTRADVAREAGLAAALAFPVFGEHGVVGAVEFYAREMRSAAARAPAPPARLRQPARPVHRAEAGRGGRARERGRADVDLRDRARRDHLDRRGRPASSSSTRRPSGCSATAARTRSARRWRR